MQRIIFAFAVLLLLASCAGAPPETPTLLAPSVTMPPPVPTRTRTLPLLTDFPAPVRTQPPAPNANPSPIALSPAGTPVPRTPQPIFADGPWLVVSSDGAPGLTVFNGSGNGWAPLQTSDHLSWYGNNLPGSAAIGGQWLALRGLKDAAALKDITLDLVHLPAARVIQVTRLDSDWTDPAIASGVRAAILGSKLLWSPDGKYIAFTAALNGSRSADLYLAQTAQAGLIRLTAREHNAYPLAWSPDSRRLIYSEMDNCAAGGCSVWQTTPLKQDVKLYDAPASRGETVVGFTQTAQVIVSGSDSGGPVGLRRVDLLSGKVETLYAGHLTAVAYDRAANNILFNASISVDTDSLADGLYEITPLSIQPVLVRPGSWSKLTWLPEINQFLAGGSDLGGTLLIAPAVPATSGGSVTPFPAENWWICAPQLSPDRKTYSFCGSNLKNESPGLRLYDLTGALVQTLTTDPVDWATWNPSGPGLFYHSNATVYYLKSLTASPEPLLSVGSGQNQGVVWVR